MTTPKPPSERKIAANRANAKKSTGPRTPEGKARSRWNAMKHGILAQAVIPPSLEPFESSTDFAGLLAALREHFCPATVIEGILVEIIAACYWRLARLARAEGGAVALSRQGAQVAEAKHEDALTTLERNVGALEKALARHDHEAVRRILQIGIWQHAYDGRLALTKGVEDLEDLRLRRRAEELRDPKATHDRANLPDAKEALAFARYEAQLHRQLHRALFALERLQRHRAGEAVPPPIAVDVTITPEPGPGSS